MSLHQYQTTNHKLRAAELRRDAAELDRRGYPCLAQVNWEMAVWLDPPPRIKPEKTPRRTEKAQECYEVTSGGYVAHDRATPPQRTPRPHVSHRPVPRGTSVINRTSEGRVLRQMGTR